MRISPPIDPTTRTRHDASWMCNYNKPNGTCFSPRATKPNAQLHRFCQHHRDAQNEDQQRYVLRRIQRTIQLNEIAPTDDDMDALIARYLGDPTTLEPIPYVRSTSSTASGLEPIPNVREWEVVAPGEGSLTGIYIAADPLAWDVADMDAMDANFATVQAEPMTHQMLLDGIARLWDELDPAYVYDAEP